MAVLQLPAGIVTTVVHRCLADHFWQPLGYIIRSGQVLSILRLRFMTEILCPHTATPKIACVYNTVISS
eukprot:SAG31_NODE_2189_length_6232_cov_11.011740_4_plen_69_part_00